VHDSYSFAARRPQASAAVEATYPRVRELIAPTMREIEARTAPAFVVEALARVAALLEAENPGSRPPL
jgi:hypothetical protein